MVPRQPRHHREQINIVTRLQDHEVVRHLAGGLHAHRPQGHRDLLARLRADGGERVLERIVARQVDGPWRLRRDDRGEEGNQCE